MSNQLLRLVIRESINSLNENDDASSVVEKILNDMLEYGHLKIIRKYIPSGDEDAELMLSTAFAIMGRESTWGKGLSITGAGRGIEHSVPVQNASAELARFARYLDKSGIDASNSLDALGNLVGIKGKLSKKMDASVGSTQIKLSNIEQGTLKNVADDLEVSSTSDISEDINAVILTAVHIYDLYNKSKGLGYSTTSPGIGGWNPEKQRQRQFTSTGNAALDLAITGYNAGASKITRYCGQGEKEIKKPCLPGEDNDFVKDYIPFFGDNTANNMFYITAIAKNLDIARPIVKKYIQKISLISTTRRSLPGIILCHD